MKNLLKIASATPNIKVGNIEYNTEVVINHIISSANKDVDILVFADCCLTGARLGSEFYSRQIIEETKENIEKIRLATKDLNILVAISVALPRNNIIEKFVYYFYNNEIVHISSAKNIEFGYDDSFIIDGYRVKTATDMLTYKNLGNILTNIYDVDILIHISSKDIDINTKEDVNIAKSIARAENCLYIYSSSAYGDTTTDSYLSNDKFIILSDISSTTSESFDDEEIIYDIANMSLLNKDFSDDSGLMFNQDISHSGEYSISNRPYMKFNNYNDIINIQSRALANRMKAINCKKLILGVSGGLDSTMALIVCKETMDYLGLPSENIIAVSMPGFGTSSRTKNNSNTLMNKIGATIKTCNIVEVVKKHLELIGHDMNNADVAFENAQARERTQILLDMANMEGAIVVGTGDLSEIALGFATYNGDHMSNYSVNASVPKSLMREVVKYYADINIELKEVLYDIIDTPVSPELLPNKEDTAVQKTEEIVGPYDLQDFFIYYYLKHNLSKSELIMLSKSAFKNIYDENTIKKWLDTFFRRFYKNQFKRNCSVDGPKVTEISMSTRTGYQFPSDMQR